MPNACYEIEASAYRRLQPEEKTADHLLEINLDLLEKARRQGHDLRNGRYLSDLELISELQHFGAATGLIDFTYNALVALWFACWKSDSDKQANGKVVVLRSDGLEALETVDYKMSQWNIDRFFKQDGDGLYRLYQWQPKDLNNRIIAQQSVFVFGGDMIEIASKCEIDARCKPEILTTLEEVSGITGTRLFADFDGFAWLNAHDKPVEQTAKAYKLRGIEALQKKNLRRAIDLLTQSIRLDPENPETYFHRARAYRRDSQFDKSIEDCNTMIEYYKKAMGDDSELTKKWDPNLAKAYNTRGVAYASRKQYAKAIKSYKAAIKRDPNLTKAYCNRGAAYASRKQYAKAIKSYKAAIKRDPEMGYAYGNYGEALLHKGKWKKARKKLTNAQEMGVDIIASFRNDYKNVRAFEKKTGRKLPKDLAKMLTPP